MKIQNLKAPAAFCALGASLLASYAGGAQVAASPPPSNDAAKHAQSADVDPSADQGASTLIVTFQGMKTLQGDIMVSLAQDPAGFSGSKPAVAQEKLAVTGPEATATFTGLVPGRYAVRAFHDLDGDGKLKTNAFGVPLEPYAFSNNARGLAGPPSFEAASFEVGPGVTTHAIPID